MGWTAQQIEPMTVRQLLAAYDGYLLATWDHTALIAATTYNLGVLVARLGSKARPKGRTAADFHPYREKPQRGLRITPDKIGLLRQIFSRVRAPR